MSSFISLVNKYFVLRINVIDFIIFLMCQICLLIPKFAYAKYNTHVIFGWPILSTKCYFWENISRSLFFEFIISKCNWVLLLWEISCFLPEIFLLITQKTADLVTLLEKSLMENFIFCAVRNLNIYTNKNISSSHFQMHLSFNIFCNKKN